MKHIYTLEFWKDIKGYEGLYQISNVGQVRSLSRYGVKGKILKPVKLNTGYLQVILYKNKKRQHFSIHHLVAEAFLPNEEELPEVDHINNDRTDNRVANLQWISRADNNRKRNSGWGQSKHVQCLETGEIFESVAAAAKSVNRGMQAMSQHLRGIRNSCAGLHFKYYQEDDV